MTERKLEINLNLKKIPSKKFFLKKFSNLSTFLVLAIREETLMINSCFLSQGCRSFELCLVSDDF